MSAAIGRSAGDPLATSGLDDDTGKRLQGPGSPSNSLYMFLGTTLQTATFQSIRVESISFSSRGAFVSYQVTARQDWNEQSFDLDDLTLLIRIIERDAADSGYDIDAAGRNTDLKNDARLSESGFVDLVKRSAKRRE